MKIYFYALLCICFTTGFSYAQAIKNVRAEVKGDIIQVYYDLEGTLEGQLYQVSLYSSHNDMVRPVSYVEGDAGENIKPGASKKIEWLARKELSHFKGEITFEVQATLVFSPISIKNPVSASVYKRGKSYKLDWEGGIANENLNLELYQGDTKLTDITRTPNNHNFEWKIPSGIKSGNNYKIRISSTDKPENFRLSDTFAIKRKIPTVVKLVPLGILVGAAVFIMTSGDDGEKPGPVTENKQLPAPINP